MTAPADVQRATPAFVADLARHGGRPALIGGAAAVSYADLAARVDEVARRLGPTRRLVVVEASSTVPGVVAYLAALAGGQPVLLVAPGDGCSELVGRYQQDAVLRADGDRVDVDARRAWRAGSAHDLHPDLALLLSTSGSTGSPRLVRLSAANVQANAEQVAASLHVDETDVAITTLPLHYCYGLSVLHSHLLRGASVVLSERSVADAAFWDLVREHRVTSFAGVPYTFDLLDRVGFAQRDLPDLRYVTQAGGRLAPDRVRRFAELGRRRGWDLVVMYGQTEATARMAVLPPGLAVDHPAAVGVAVPGGALRLDPVDGRGPVAEDARAVGEIVYTGPNVMLGYADSPADLSLGRTVDELRTGDLGRWDAAGLLEIVGRRSRTAKVFGLRIDLDRVDDALADADLAAACADGGDRLVVGVVAPGRLAQAVAVVARAAGLPERSVVAVPVPSLPRLPSGKPDLVALRALAAPADVAPAPEAAPAADEPALVALYAEVLGRPDVTADSSFVDLGGDSLSYVEMSLRLEDRLGRLPDDWPTASIRLLCAPAPRATDPAPPLRRRSSWRWVETAVLMRALAILGVVAGHVGLAEIYGGAHVLLAAAGYSFARFQLTAAPRLVRLRRQARSIARIVVPSVLWIGVAALLTGAYDVTTVLLLNELVAEPVWSAQWHFWFVEILVYLLVVLLAVLALPWSDRAERRWPFGFALAVLGVGLVLRFDVVDLGWTQTLPVLWLFALGWAAARAASWPGRLLLSAAAAWGAWDYFGDPARDALVLGGVLALVWVRQVRLPAPLVAAAGPLAAASLYLYLTHWQVYPALDALPDWLVLLACVAVGIGAWRLTRWLTRWLGRMLSHPVPGAARLRVGSRRRAAPTG